MGHQLPEYQRHHEKPSASTDDYLKWRIGERQQQPRSEIQSLLRKGGDALMFVVAAVGVVGFFAFVCSYAWTADKLQAFLGLFRSEA